MPLVQTTLSTTGNSGPAAIEELINNLTTFSIVHRPFPEITQTSEQEK